MFYKILALDGGGIRSVYSAQLLFRLHDKFKILNKVDMLAGTSGGSIITAGLSCGWSASQIVDFFRGDGPDIFERSRYPGMIDDIAYSTKSKYGSGRRRIFQKYFGDKRVADAQKAIVIPSWDARHKSGLWQSVSFTNFKSSPLRDVSFVDAVMASTAGPVYFPVHPGPSEEAATKYIDGGLWANNPADAAMSEALREDHGGVEFKKVVVLSIGTTMGRQILDTPKNDLGWLDWLRSGVIDLLTDAAKISVDYKMRNTLGPRYCRVDQIVDRHIPMDDIDSMDRLIDLANATDLDPIEAWLQGFWL